MGDADYRILIVVSVTIISNSTVPGAKVQRAQTIATVSQ